MTGEPSVCCKWSSGSAGSGTDVRHEGEPAAVGRRFGAGPKKPMLSRRAAAESSFHCRWRRPCARAAASIVDCRPAPTARRRATCRSGRDRDGAEDRLIGPLEDRVSCLSDSTSTRRKLVFRLAWSVSDTSTDRLSGTMPVLAALENGRRAVWSAASVRCPVSHRAHDEDFSTAYSARVRTLTRLLVGRPGGPGVDPTNRSVSGTGAAANSRFDGFSSANIDIRLAVQRSPQQVSSHRE